MIKTLADVRKNEPATVDLLKTIALTDESQYVRGTALASVIELLTDPEQSVDFLRQFLQHPDVTVQSNALNAMRTLKASPQAKVLVFRCLDPDQAESVRTTAIHMLAEGWKDDPGTFGIVRAHALGHDTSLQPTALWALGNNWKEDPETLPLLQGVARFDPNDTARRSAVNQLWERWPQ